MSYVRSVVDKFRGFAGEQRKFERHLHVLEKSHPEIVKALDGFVSIYAHGDMAAPPPPPSLLLFQEVDNVPGNTSVAAELRPAGELGSGAEDARRYGHIPPSTSVRLMSDGNIVAPDLYHYGGEKVPVEWWLAVVTLMDDTGDAQKRFFVNRAVNAIKAIADHESVSLEIKMNIDPEEAAAAAVTAMTSELRQARESLQNQLEEYRDREAERISGAVATGIMLAAKYKMTVDGGGRLVVKFPEPVYPRIFSGGSLSRDMVLDPDKLPDRLAALVGIKSIELSVDDAGLVTVYIPAAKRHPHADSTLRNMCSGNVDIRLDGGIIERIREQMLERVNMNSLYDGDITRELLRHAEATEGGVVDGVWSSE